MNHLKNPFRGTGLATPSVAEVPWPSANAAAPVALLERCPATGQTPLIDAADFAEQIGIAQLWIKDERARMGLGSFKALGAAYVIACDHQDGVAAGQTYVTASAGNHGLSVAAGAAAFGAKAVIFLSQTVPEAFAARLRDIGATVERAGTDYEASMQAAADYADRAGAILLSDSSWPGYMDRPHRLMEGYTVLMAEIFDQIDAAPTHIMLQAGVGGLASACAAMARAHWGDAPNITVVEPDAAPCLFASIKDGDFVTSSGPVSAMGRLDCKEASLIALKGLARDADSFVTISEAQGNEGAKRVAEAGYPSTASGAAGLSALLHTDLAADSRVLLILSEGPE